MSNFTLQMDHVIHTFNDALYHMINVKIKIVDGKFPVTSVAPFINATDGITTAHAFSTAVSGNQKEINGNFTSDAFTGMTTDFTIEFGFGKETTGSFEHVTAAAIEPLDPVFSSVTVPDADNTWLQNLLTS